MEDSMEMHSFTGLVKIEVINIISVRLRTNNTKWLQSGFYVSVESNQVITLDLVLILLGFEIGFECCECKEIGLVLVKIRHSIEDGPLYQ